MGITLPKTIIFNLEIEKNNDDKIVIPAYRAIYNYKATKNNIDKCRMDFAQLTIICKSNNNIPVEEDNPYVINYQIRVDDDDIIEGKYSYDTSFYSDRG